jgi:hypothetical protein
LPEGNYDLHWTSNTRDLLELIDAIYQMGIIRDSQGKTVSFHTLVAAASDVLHIQANKYEYKERAEIANRNDPVVFIYKLAEALSDKEHRKK